MSRGERLLGPKRNTGRGKREYRRERNEARKAKRIESEIESERDERWERLSVDVCTYLTYDWPIKSFKRMING